MEIVGRCEVTAFLPSSVAAASKPLKDSYAGHCGTEA